MKTTDNQEELFDLVNVNDEVIGVVKRREANRNKSLYHRAVVIFVFNDRGELFLQKRSRTKDVEPGTWTVSASGHLGRGQSYAEGVVRELEEELGVKAPVRLLRKIIIQSQLETEINAIYEAKHAGPFRLHPLEIETGKFMKLEEIEDQIRINKLPVSLWTLTHLQYNYGILPELKHLRKNILKIF